jgi:hypothetical protein
MGLRSTKSPTVCGLLPAHAKVRSSACSPASLALCRSPRFGVAEVECARKLLKRRLPPPGVLVDAGSSVANEYISQVWIPPRYSLLFSRAHS